MVEPKDLLTPSILEEFLGNKEARQKASMELQALQVNPAWVLIERVLSRHINNYAEEILNNDALGQEAEVALKRERAFFLLFKSIPQGWVKELMSSPIETGQDENDPYA